MNDKKIYEIMKEYNYYNDDYKKYKTLEDYIDFDDVFKKKKEWEESGLQSGLSLSQLINMYGLQSVMAQLIEKHPIEKILELLDIKDMQQFLRKKKLEQIKSDKDV